MSKPAATTLLLLGPGPRLRRLCTLLSALSAESPSPPRLAQLADLGELLEHDSEPARLLLDQAELPLEDLGMVRRFLDRRPSVELVLLGDEPSEAGARRLLSRPGSSWLAWPPAVDQLEELLQVERPGDAGQLDDKAFKPRAHSPALATTTYAEPRRDGASEERSAAHLATSVSVDPARELSEIEAILGSQREAEVPDPATLRSELLSEGAPTDPEVLAEPPRTVAPPERLDLWEIGTAESAAEPSVDDLDRQHASLESTLDRVLDEVPDHLFEPGAPQSDCASEEHLPKDEPNGFDPETALESFFRSPLDELPEATPVARSFEPSTHAEDPSSRWLDRFAERATYSHMTRQPVEQPASSGPTSPVPPPPYFHGQVGDLAQAALALEAQLTAARTAAELENHQEVEAQLGTLSGSITRLLLFARTLSLIADPPPAGGQVIDLGNLLREVAQLGGSQSVLELQAPGGYWVPAEKSFLTEALDAVLATASAAVAPGRRVQVKLEAGRDADRLVARVTVRFAAPKLEGLSPAAILTPYRIRERLPNIGANALLAAHSILVGQGGSLALGRGANTELCFTLELPLAAGPRQT